MKDRIRSFIDSKWFVAIIVALVFIFICAWAWVIPFAKGPDEHMRYRVVTWIVEHGKLPRGDEQDLIDPLWGISYAFQPITTYIVSAGFYKIAAIFTQDGRLLLFASRMVNVLISSGTAIVVISIAKKAFKGTRVWFFVALAMTLPQFIFVSAYVNMDALALFSCALMFFMWIYGGETNWNMKAIIGLGIAVGLCAISYYNAFGFVLCTIIYFCATVIQGEKGNKDWWKVLLKKGLIITLIVAAIAGWWYIRSYILYDGDIFGMTASNICGEKYAIPELKPSLHTTPQKCGMGFFEMVFGDWFKNCFVGFIGWFGMMDLQPSVSIYKLYTVIFGVGIIASLLSAPKWLRYKDKETKAYNPDFWMIICSGLAIVITIGLAAYYSYAVDYQVQGRYWLPMMIPFMYIVTYGWNKLYDLIKIKNIYKDILCVLGTALVIALSVYCYVGTICPAY